MIQLNPQYEAIFNPRRSTSSRLLPRGRKNIDEDCNKIADEINDVVLTSELRQAWFQRPTSSARLSKARTPLAKGKRCQLPAGRVHAICGGILLAEVQQSSDVTYRIYDYNRPGMDGKPRELHTDLAAQALNFNVEPNYRTEYDDTSNRAVQIIDTPYFDVWVMEIFRPFHRDLRKYDSFVISMCIEGDCKIRIRSTGEEILLHAGHTTLIPAAIADYDVLPLHATSLILDAFIDNHSISLANKLTRFFHATQA